MDDKEQIQYKRDYARMIWATDYTLQHLASHLQAGGQHEKLFRLLVGNSAWMNVKFDKRHNDSSFVDDIEVALGNFRDPITIPQLIVLIQLITAQQVVKDRVDLHNDSDLEVLVWLNQEDEALGYARLRGEVIAKVSGLATICETQHKRGYKEHLLLDEMLNIYYHTAFDLDNSISIQKIILDTLHNIGYLDEIDAFMSNVFDPWLLSEIMRKVGISNTQVRNIKNILVSINSIANPWKQAKALQNLVIALAEASHIEKARQILIAIKFDEIWFETVERLGAIMVLKGHYKKLCKTLSIIVDDATHIDTLLQIASILVREGHDAYTNMVFKEAHKIANRNDNWVVRVDLLLRISATLARLHRIDEALQIIAAIDKIPYSALSNHAVVLAASGALSEALYSCSLIRSEEDQHETLYEILKISIDFSHLEKALLVIPYLTNSNYQIMPGPLGRLVAGLLQLDRETEARQIIMMVQDEVFEQSGLLASTVECLLQAQLFQKAREIAELIVENERRADALAKLALKLAESGCISEAKELFSFSMQAKQAAVLPGLRGGVLKAITQAFVQTGHKTEADAVSDYSKRALNIRGEFIRAYVIRERDSKLMDESAQAVFGGRIVEGLLRLRSLKLEEYIKCVAEQYAAFETLQANLSMEILFQVTRIASWRRNEWGEIHALTSD